MKITVLMGGASAERNVSLASGIRIVLALRSKGHDVIAFDPSRGPISGAEQERLASSAVGTEPPSLEALAATTGGAFLPALERMPELADADVVFLALHGGQGEDGTLQALLDMAHIRYTGSGHLSSALAMDKDLSKILFRAAGVRTPDWLMAPATVEEVERNLGYPVVVKPSKQGSTVGLSVVKKREQLEGAIEEAWRYDDEVMIEQFIPGRELTVGILGDLALPVGEIKPVHEIYDYECKYTAGMATEEFPAKLSTAGTRQIQQQALAAFRALKLSGYARIDFRLSQSDDDGSAGQFYCLEANTLPGMTELSLIPQGAAAAGMSFPDLCEAIVKLESQNAFAMRKAQTDASRADGNVKAGRT
ncbi:MAG TPA: D-alanine--D-alanine ligase [Gemmatimonadaceae bacterium]|nr:D-alanine--D-alanine ligase [Gemmatimonadaceae bacterium]